MALTPYSTTHSLLDYNNTVLKVRYPWLTCSSE